MNDRVDSSATTDAFKERNQVSLLWVLAVLVRERRIIAIFVVVGLMAGVLVALLAKRSFTATFSFVPQSASDPAQTSLARLAGQFGVSLGASLNQTQSPQFYADLLETREILAPIAQDTFGSGDRGEKRTALQDFIGASGGTEWEQLDATVGFLRANVVKATVAARTTGVVTVNVTTASPHVSVGVAERLIEELNRFNRITRQSQAAAERRFAEERLESSRAELRAAEDTLQKFLQANRQIGNSPHLSFERDRLAREVTLKQEMVASLTQQFEEARIREVRDIPVLTIIEKPVLAVRPDSSNFLSALFSGGSVAFFLALAIVLVRDAFTRHASNRGDPAIAVLTEEWNRFRRATR